jgi:hypothetical protein
VRGDVIVYKHLHGIYNVDRDDLLPYHETTRIVTRGHSLKLRKMECRGQISEFFQYADSKRVELADGGHRASVNCLKGRLDRHWA